MSTKPTNKTQRFTAKNSTTDILKDRDLKGITIAITGTTNGIGVETARSLAVAGAHVVMLCRNVTGAEKVKQNILAEISSGQVDVIECDLSSLHSVKAAADKFLENGWPLHVLILNAGIVETTEVSQKDGLSSIIATNHLAGYYLTTLLIDKLIVSSGQRKSPSRVVFVSSGSHKFTGFPKEMTSEQLTKEALFAPQSSISAYSNTLYYGSSKLCNVWSAAYLQRKYGSQGVNFYSLHPGAMIYTNIVKSPFMKVVMFLARPFTKTIAQGASTTVFCATDEELDGDFAIGKYYQDNWLCDESPQAKDVELQNKMAELSDEQISQTMA